MNNPAPLYLRRAWTTAKYGNPYSGGWMDWPAGEINKMNTCELIHKTLSQYYVDGVLHKEDPVMFEIVEDSILIDQYQFTGEIPDNEFKERVEAYAKILDG